MLSSSRENASEVGAISNRKVDRHHMMAWKEASNITEEAEAVMYDLQEVSRKMVSIKAQLPSTGTPRSTPRSDPAPPSDVAPSLDQRCGSEPKETPTPSRNEDPPQEPPPAEDPELSVYENLLGSHQLRRGF